jgi:phage repressor protein C with HTH and peptisase S24 domain
VPRRLSESDRRCLARHFGVAEHVLGGPDDGGHVVLTRPGMARAQDDFVTIRQLAVGASAGNGALVSSEATLATLAFQAGFINDVASGSPDALAVIGVEGDSMLPTLADGDQIMVDTDDRHRLRDGIYVFEADGALLVKRLSISPASRRLSIRSDNDAYPSWDDCDPDSVRVIGRVVWMGRRLR